MHTTMADPSAGEEGQRRRSSGISGLFSSLSSRGSKKNEGEDEGHAQSRSRSNTDGEGRERGSSVSKIMRKLTGGKSDEAPDVAGEPNHHDEAASERKKRGSGSSISRLMTKLSRGKSEPGDGSIDATASSSGQQKRSAGELVRNLSHKFLDALDAGGHDSTMSLRDSDLPPSALKSPITKDKKKILFKLKKWHKNQQKNVRWADDDGTEGESARLAQLELEKQIAEARYEVYKENMLPGLEEKEQELLALQREIAAIKEKQWRREGDLLVTEHEVEGPEEYDRTAAPNHLSDWDDLKNCVIDTMAYKLREMQETLHPDSYATSRGFPAGTQLDITHTPFRERADGSLSLNVLAATNTHDYNDLNNFIHLLVPPGENLRMGRSALRRSAMTPYNLLYRLNPIFLEP